MKKVWNSPVVTIISVKKITLSGSHNGNEHSQAPSHKN